MTKPYCYFRFPYGLLLSLRKGNKQKLYKCSQFNSFLKIQVWHESVLLTTGLENNVLERGRKLNINKTTSNYMFKVHNRNIRKRYATCLKLTIKTAGRRQAAVLFNCIWSYRLIQELIIAVYHQYSHRNKVT